MRSCEDPVLAFVEQLISTGLMLVDVLSGLLMIYPMMPSLARTQPRCSSRC